MAAHHSTTQAAALSAMASQKAEPCLGSSRAAALPMRGEACRGPGGAAAAASAESSGDGMGGTSPGVFASATWSQ